MGFNQRPLIVPLVMLIFVLMLGVVHCNRMEESKIPVTTQSKAALNDYSMGLDLWERLRYSEARKYFHQAIQKDPDFAMAHLYYALLSTHTPTLFEELKKTVALVDKVSEGEKLIIFGVQAGVEGQMMEQREFYQQLVQKYPNDERGRNFLANNYFVHQDYNQAIGEYLRILEINPKFSQAYNQLGYSHRFLENYREAEEAFQQYIRLIPDDPNPYDSYADLLMKMGEFENSIKIYRKALGVDSFFLASHIGIAYDLLFLGRPEEGRTQLQKYLEIARDEREEREAIIALAIMDIHENNIQHAEEELANLYDLCAESRDTLRMADALHYLGIILMETGRLDQASDKFKASLKLVEDSHLLPDIKENIRRMAIFYSARVALASGNTGLAKSKAEELGGWSEKIRNRFHLWLYHQLLGMIALQEKQYDAALGELRRANLQDPYNLYRMALAYQAKGDRTQAQKYCEKAADFNTQNNLSYAFVRNKARELLKQLKSS